MNEMEKKLETFKKKIENANDLVSELESIRHDTSNYERLIKSFEDHLIDYKKGSEDISNSLNQLNENTSEFGRRIESIVSNLSSLTNQSNEYVNQLENYININKNKIEDLKMKTTFILDELHNNSKNQKNLNYT